MRCTLATQYLVNKFHVPDLLVPSLTELVALLVFRQARRLVFGYGRRRVVESDLAWREKASTFRLDKKWANCQVYNVGGSRRSILQYVSTAHS